MEGQALIDRIVRLDPQSMHVERFGRTLLRLERDAQRAAGDGTIRFDRIIDVAAIPSVPVPAAATAWARAHGFRIIAADGSGLALVTPTLAGMHRSTLGVLPLGEMVDGASPMPMAIVPESSRTMPPTHRASVPGTGAL
jgi:hypothetical protein